MTIRTTLLGLMITLTAMGTPSRLWAVQRTSLNFYTRIGSHQLEMDRPLLAPTQTSDVILDRPLDCGAGMHYQKGGLHLQVGPTYDLTTPGLMQQKVNMEGHIGVRW